MIRAVFDTNVLASGFVEFAAAERPPARLLRLWQEQRFALVVSDGILIELINTFATPYFRRQLTPEQIAAAHHLLHTEAMLTPLTTMVPGVTTHPEDDLVLSAAVSAGVDYLVTGDKPLQRLLRYQHVQILSPREFLDLLEVTGSEEV